MTDKEMLFITYGALSAMNEHAASTLEVVKELLERHLFPEVDAAEKAWDGDGENL